MTDESVVVGLIVAVQLSRRAQKLALLRERAIKMHASDPELSFRDIAARLGVRAEQIPAWLNGTTRSAVEKGKTSARRGK